MVLDIASPGRVAGFPHVKDGIKGGNETGLVALFEVFDQPFLDGGTSSEETDRDADGDAKVPEAM
jgi:hypothetical protein